MLNKTESHWSLLNIYLLIKIRFPVANVLRVNSTGNEKEMRRTDQRLLQSPRLVAVAVIYSGYIGDIF